MIIKAYGEFWTREGINSTQREILGRRRNNPNCNIWDQRGTYALYSNFKIVYVGKADDRAIGRRLTEHLKDRLRKRWDSFSWFGVKEINADGSLQSYSETPINQSDAIRSMELLGIVLSDAPLNRQQGKFPGAEKIWQINDLPTKESELHQKLDDILELIKKTRQEGPRQRSSTTVTKKI